MPQHTSCLVNYLHVSLRAVSPFSASHPHSFSYFFSVCALRNVDNVSPVTMVTFTEEAAGWLITLSLMEVLP